MIFLDKRRNSGRSSVIKVVGAPRFELGTPCTPCEQSVSGNCLNFGEKSDSASSRNDVECASVSPCSASKATSDSGRRAGDMRALYQTAKRKRGIPAQLAQPALLTDRIQPLRRPTLRLKSRGRIDRECLLGLIVVALIMAGAAALYWVPNPTPPAITHCPPSDNGNRWCLR